METQELLFKSNDGESKGHKFHLPTLRFIENVKLPLKMAPDKTISSEESPVSHKSRKQRKLGCRLQK